ncbi:MAG: hypothetical protein RLY60_521 [Pseudomonadota bacterium]
MPQLNPVTLFAAESAYNQALFDYRVRADRIMVGMNFFLCVVCLAIAPYRQSWDAALLIGLPTLGLTYWLQKNQAGELITRITMACAFMVYTSLIIHQSGGDIEAHFAAFGLIGVLLYYRDWRTIFAATVFIYLQHLVAGYAQYIGYPVYVFDTHAFWSTFVLHVAYFLPFVGMMGYLSVWLRREGVEQQRIIAQVRGNEVELMQARDRAEVANRLKSEILANISHEIRTPMNGMLGLIQLMRETSIDDKQREYLQLAQSSGDQLLSIINNILDLSKIESGAMDMESASVRLPQLLQQTLRLFEPLAHKKNLLLQLNLNPNTPAQVMTDPVRLRQVLSNLIDNAIKFTAEGRVDVDVWSENSPDQQHVRLYVCVRDTGMGFDPSQADALFSPFVQADSSITRQFGGTGLGLAITRRLVQNMGGHIRADSQPGQGAEFTFSVVCARSPNEAAESTLETHSTQPAQTVHMEVLIAEDNPVNQMVAKMMLERLGHRVQVVADGKQCLQALAQHPFDLLLLDVMMPQMDGLAALAQIRRMEAGTQAHLPVMMVTAHAMRGDEERFHSLGADGYLSKPINQASLEKEIARLGLMSAAHAN